MADSYYEHLFGIRDRVVLVTGGTRGIGRLIAEGMVRCGGNVYVASRKVEACRETESELSEFGHCTAIVCDISTVDGCRTLAAQIAEREPKLDVLVNNAGVTWSADIDEFTEKSVGQGRRSGCEEPVFPDPKPTADVACCRLCQFAGGGDQYLFRQRIASQWVTQLFLRCRQSRSAAVVGTAGAGSECRQHKCQCDRTRSFQIENDSTAVLQ